jgi:predicted DNA-binding transcriptional regulator AlpA
MSKVSPGGWPRQIPRSTQCPTCSARPIDPRVEAMRAQPANSKSRIAFGYQEWMDELKRKGFEIFFITIMFDFNRSPELTIRSMRAAIEKCYSHLDTSLFRHPGTLRGIDEMPLLAAFIEAPSAKQRAIGKSSFWGTHFHGFLAMPPASRTRTSTADALKKFKRYAKRKCPIILRMHLERARNEEKIASYSLKARGRRLDGFMDQFDILLPRRREEMQHSDSAPRKPRRPRPNLIESAGRPASGMRPRSKKGNKNMDTSKLLTREEVANAIKVSLVKLDRMRLAGSAPPEIKIGRSVRFSQSAFEQWLNRQTSQNSMHVKRPGTERSKSRKVRVDQSRKFEKFGAVAKSSGFRKLR